jgi:hypothetical protein
VVKKGQAMLNRELYIDIKMCDNENGGKVVSLHNVIPNYDLIKDDSRHDVVLEFMRDMLVLVDSSSSKLVAEDQIIYHDKRLQTKSKILNTVNKISKLMEENDYWRWEIIKVIVRHRNGDLSTPKAQNAIIDLVKYMPDLFPVQAYIDEFRADHGENND